MRRPNGFFLTSMGVFLLLVAAFLTIPLVTLVMTSLSAPGGGLTLENYLEVFGKKLYQVSFRNSILLSLESSALGLVLALVSSYAITRLGSEGVQRNLLVVVNMTSNFAGIPLAFALTLLLGNTGMFVTLSNMMGYDLAKHFNVYSAQGLVVAYTYFQVPLGIMLLYPVYRGVREDWREAASTLGANGAQFWARVGAPVILPSVLSTFTVLFANAMGAYATAYYIVSSSYNIVPIRIGALVSGDIRTRPELGSALAVSLAFVLIAAMILSDWAGNLAGREEDKP
jgi:putative spermidine/putrescine transport system permease protein